MSSRSQRELHLAPTTRPNRDSSTAVPTTTETQFAARDVVRKKTESNVRTSDILLLLAAFLLVIGGYMVIREHDKKNNIAHAGGKTTGSTSKRVSSRTTGFPIDLAEYNNGTKAPTADQNTTTESNETSPALTKTRKKGRRTQLVRLASSSKAGAYKTK